MIETQVDLSAVQDSALDPEHGVSPSHSASQEERRSSRNILQEEFGVDHDLCLQLAASFHWLHLLEPKLGCPEVNILFFREFQDFIGSAERFLSQLMTGIETWGVRGKERCGDAPSTLGRAHTARAEPPSDRSSALQGSPRHCTDGAEHTMPSRPLDRCLHHDERSMWNAFLAVLLPVLKRVCPRWFRHGNEDLFNDCIVDACSLLHSPGPFNPFRGNVLGFTRGAIRRYLANRLRSERRRRKHEKTVNWSLEGFEKKRRDVVNTHREDNDRIEGPDFRLEENTLNSLLSHLSPAEQTEVELLVERRPVEDWLRFLELEDRPEGRKRVYREKDRVKKKLRRLTKRKSP
jgi:hypothetical protein